MVSESTCSLALTKPKKNLNQNKNWCFCRCFSVHSFSACPTSCSTFGLASWFAWQWPLWSSLSFGVCVLITSVDWTGRASISYNSVSWASLSSLARRRSCWRNDKIVTDFLVNGRQIGSSPMVPKWRTWRCAALKNWKCNGPTYSAIIDYYSLINRTRSNHHSGFVKTMLRARRFHSS